MEDLVIFVSYRWGDWGKNESAFDDLRSFIEKSSGLKVIRDDDILRSGNFVEQLETSVRSAFVFMPIVTKAYLSFGQAGGRDEKKDFCLFEYKTAILSNVKIVPILIGVSPKAETVTYETARAIAEKDNCGNDGTVFRPARGY